MECNISTALTGEIYDMQHVLTFAFRRIKALPRLPIDLENLGIVECNAITELQKYFPPELTHLTIHRCVSLTHISSLPPKLVTFRCTLTPITELPQLPKTLAGLSVEGCEKLTNLPTLPPELQWLQCTGCQNLVVIPILPRYLTYVNCSGCDSLLSIRCSGDARIVIYPRHLSSLTKRVIFMRIRIALLAAGKRARRRVLTRNLIRNQMGLYVWMSKGGAKDVCGQVLKWSLVVTENEFSPERIRSGVARNELKNRKIIISFEMANTWATQSCFGWTNQPHFFLAKGKTVEEIRQMMLASQPGAYPVRDPSPSHYQVQVQCSLRDRLAEEKATRDELRHQAERVARNGSIDDVRAFLAKLKSVG